MRWLLRTLLILVILLAVYVGTAVASLKGLVADTQRGDVAAIMSRVDLPRLRNSLAEQIVRAHFKRIEQTRPVKTIERVAAPTVVDALLATLLTADNIAKVLQSGALPTPDGSAVPPVIALPSLSGAGLESTLRIVTRLRPKSPVQLQILLDDGGEATIRLHFEGTHWKLSGIDLPAAALQKLISNLTPK
jgi:hypothetical protein